MENKQTSRIFAFIGLSIANLIGCLDLTIVNTALPSIQSALNLNDLQLQWIMNALLLALAACMVVAGKLADRYGKRLMLYIGMILFATASLAAGLSQNFALLILFRFFQGISIAILYTVPVTFLPILFPEKTGRAMGILFGASGLGLTAGPVIGGILTTLFGWHAIFFINIPIIMIALAFCLKTLPASKEMDKNKIDFIGMGLLIIALPVLIFTTVNTRVVGWASERTLWSYLLVLTLFYLFYRQEKKAVSPIISFHLFLKKQFVVGLIANFFLAFFYAVDFFFIPLHLHSFDNFSDEKIGLILLLPTMMVAFISPLSGGLCDRLGPGLVLCIGYMCFIFSAFLQLQLVHLIQMHLLWIPYIFFGIGWACILSPSLFTALSALPKEMGGVAMGTVGTLHNFGGALGLAIGATLTYMNAMTLILSTSVASLLLILFGAATFKKRST